MRRIRGNVGFVFQQFNLVNRLSVHHQRADRHLEPPAAVADPDLPLSARRSAAWRSPRSQRVGIADWAFQRAANLSGGQQQRAAIARAMVQRAQLVLADEPIASLDPEAARRVMESLAELNRVDGVTVLVSLHQVQFAMRYCPRTVALRDGKVVFDGPQRRAHARKARRTLRRRSAKSCCSAKRSRPPRRRVRARSSASRSRPKRSPSPRPAEQFFHVQPEELLA